MGAVSIPPIYTPRAKGGTLGGFNPYTTGGVAFDPGGFGLISYFDILIQTRGTLPVAEFEFAYNSPSNGQVTITVKRLRYDKLTSVTTAQNPPAGVTVQGTSGQTVSTESAHIHAIDHNHASVNSAGPINGTGPVLAGVGTTGGTGHTHAFDIVDHVQNSPASSHAHVWNILYQHQHAFGLTATVASSIEVANGADLSASTWHWFAAGR